MRRPVKRRLELHQNERHIELPDVLEQHDEGPHEAGYARTFKGNGEQ